MRPSAIENIFDSGIDNGCRIFSKRCMSDLIKSAPTRTWLSWVFNNPAQTLKIEQG